MRAVGDFGSFADGFGKFAFFPSTRAAVEVAKVAVATPGEIFVSEFVFFDTCLRPHRNCKHPSSALVVLLPLGTAGLHSRSNSVAMQFWRPLHAVGVC